MTRQNQVRAWALLVVAVIVGGALLGSGVQPTHKEPAPAVDKVKQAAFDHCRNVLASLEPERWFGASITDPKNQAWCLQHIAEFPPKP